MYATTQDIIDLYGREFVEVVALRPDEASLTEPATAAAITDALAQATSEADSYIAQRYATPVANRPRVLEVHVINIACHHLAATQDRMTEIIRQRYEDAMRWLKDVAAGKAKLGPGDDGQGGTISEAAPQHIIIDSAEPRFGREGS